MGTANRATAAADVTSCVVTSGGYVFVSLTEPFVFGLATLIANEGWIRFEAHGDVIDLREATGGRFELANFGAGVTLFGSAGDDFIGTESGGDTLFGGAGKDTFYIDKGWTTVADLGTGDNVVVTAYASMVATVTSSFVATSASWLDKGGTLEITTNGYRADLSAATGVGGTIVIRNTGAATNLAGAAGNDVFYVHPSDTINGGTHSGYDAVMVAGTMDMTGGSFTFIDKVAGTSGDDAITLSSAQYAQLTSLDLLGGNDSLTLVVSGKLNFPGQVVAAGVEATFLRGSPGVDTIQVWNQPVLSFVGGLATATLKASK